MLPSVFISHADPNIALDGSASHQFLTHWGEVLPWPKAIVIMSAHHGQKQLKIGTALRYKTIHDFGGFDEALYTLEYPAVGEPQLAARIIGLLNEEQCAPTRDDERGLDHGAWIPLSLMYPDASIPIVTISTLPGENAAYHFKLGRVLQKLRQEGILIIGSGSLSHNIREIFEGHGETPKWVVEFCQWIYTCLDSGDIEQLLGWQQYAPHSLRNHPSPEHFLPFFLHSVLRRCRLPIPPRIRKCALMCWRLI